MNLPAIMNVPWLRRLLGIPAASGQFREQPHLSFATSWTLWVAAALLATSLIWFTYNYYRDGTRPNWWLKSILVGFRLLSILALMLMLAQPTLRLAKIDRTAPTVLLLVDNSQSMTITEPRLPASRREIESAGTGISADSISATTRLTRANALLDKSKALTRLAERYNVHLYSFAGTPHSIPLPTDKKQRMNYKFNVAPDTENGDSTQTGAALSRALDETAGQPVAGALIISDGGSNLGEDPIQTADRARQLHIPVSTAGLGDPTKTKDVALLSVLADDVVRVNNTVTVYAAISQRGYAGKTVTITLQRDNEIVGRETVRLGPDEQKQEVHFTYSPTRAGRFAYTVTAAALPGEITLANNKRAFVQTVIDKKLKVLYIEAEPRYEYRYLRNAILRDNSLDFACLLLSGDNADKGGEGNIPINRFPPDEKSLFEYDIIVLGDVPRSYFDDTQLQAIRRFVEDRGASLLVIAGEQHMPHEYAGTPLEAVLPVVIAPTPDPVQTDDPFQWQLTPEGKRSPVMQLEDDSAGSERVWRELPGMFWAAGVPRAKPGATVLAVHPSRRNADGPYPLVATQPFGAGKCFLQLVDSTWRWRWRVGDRYFYRYWGQVFRTLTPKELPGNSRFVQLNADRSNYRLTDKVALNARLLDAYYHPIKVPSVTATVIGEGGQSQQITLQAAAGTPGLYTAQFQPDRVGHYTTTVVSPVDTQAKASAAFVVESLALEKQKPELDEKQLRQIAAAGGGKYYRSDKIGDWIDSLPYHPLQIRSEQEYELWNAPLILILFLLPLSLEWIVRKRKGLL